MALAPYRGSTQDNSLGVQVAQSINEDGSASGTLVAGVQVGNKNTYPEVVATGITTAFSFAGGDMTTGGFAASGLISIGNALNVAARATCNIASSTLVGRLAFYNNVSGCLGMGPQLSFISDKTLRLGNGAGDFVSQVNLTDANSANLCKFFADSVPTGSIWTVYCRGV